MFLMKLSVACYIGDTERAEQIASAKYLSAYLFLPSTVLENIFDLPMVPHTSIWNKRTFLEFLDAVRRRRTLEHGFSPGRTRYLWKSEVHVDLIEV
jgi:hypothetical protein